jgi:alpha-ketoglutarate-dependent taurine dioxygenase
MEPEMTLKTKRIVPFGLLIEPSRPNLHIQDIDVPTLRELWWSEQLIILRGFHSFSTSEEFSKYCELWGEISVWPFGKVLELFERSNPEDHIFDNNYVPLHWDGMYRPQVPEFQLFHCVQAPNSAQGGRTTFSNTILALENTPRQTIDLWEKVKGRYQRKMEYYNSETFSPIIDTHPYRGFSVIRYNEPPIEGFGSFLNPPILEFSGVTPEEMIQVHRSLREALYSPKNYYAHAWLQGDMVVADNFSLLHGRESFETKAPRHLRRVHVLSDPPLTNPRLISYKV